MSDLIMLCLCMLAFLPARLLAADRWVATRGTDASNDCAVATTPCASIGHAIDQSASGDTINVASGAYHEGVRVQTTTILTFLGGWNAGFTQRDPRGAPAVINSAPTTLPPFNADGRHRDRTWVVYADSGATIDVTIDGFVLTRGQAVTNLPELPQGANFRAGGGLTVDSYDSSAVTVTVRDTVITNNRSVDAGGGVLLYAASGGSFDATFDRVQITKNKAGLVIGGIYAAIAPFGGTAPSTASLKLVNSVVAQNRGKYYAGGLSVENYGASGSSMTFDLVASTVTRNTAVGPSVLIPGSNEPGGGGLGLIATLPLTVNIIDSIVWGNKATGAGVGQDIFKGAVGGNPGTLTLNLDHNDLGDVVLGPATINDLGGNLKVDPHFARPLPHLSPTSPLVDVGTCNGVPPTDFEGDPRPTGTTCDIGADEVVP